MTKKAVFGGVGGEGGQHGGTWTRKQDREKERENERERERERVNSLWSCQNSHIALVQQEYDDISRVKGIVRPKTLTVPSANGVLTRGGIFHNSSSISGSK